MEKAAFAQLRQHHARADDRQSLPFAAGQALRPGRRDNAQRRACRPSFIEGFDKGRLSERVAEAVKVVAVRIARRDRILGIDGQIAAHDKSSIWSATANLKSECRTAIIRGNRPDGARRAARSGRGAE